MVDGKVAIMDNYPQKGRVIELEFLFSPSKSVRVPFTEVPLAAEWGKYLQGVLQSLSTEQK